VNPITDIGTQDGTPSWVGMDLAPLPFESAVSSLWRFTWRNVLSPGALLHIFSSRKRFSGWQYGADIAWLDHNKVKDATGWNLYSDEERDFLFGLGKDSALWVHMNFRFCPLCLEDTYHSFWYQSVYMVACPLHDVELRAVCQSCGAPTQKYAFTSQLLASPYACNICRRPLAGVTPSVDGWRAAQARGAELKACFVPFSAWWDKGRFVRVRLRESTVGSPSGGGGTRRAQQIMRAALQDCCGVIPQLKVYRLPLEWTFWRSVATAPMLTSYVDNGPMYRDYVEDAYRHTVRYLEAAITARFPYSIEDYQHHLNFRITEDGVSITQYQPHLLALAIMRRKMEADFGYLAVRQENCPMKDPFRFNSPKRRTRQHCRSAFLCVYASAFACVKGARNLTISVEELTAVGVHDLNVYVDEGKLWKRGQFGYVQFQWGAAVWPEVAGLQLSKSAYVRSGEAFRIPCVPHVRP
jgi:hypothetical protein